MRVFRFSVVFAVAVIVDGGLHRSFAQAPTPQKREVTPQMREVAAYGALIAGMAHVEEKTRATTSGKGLRASASGKIGLTEAEFSKFLDVCKTANDRIKPLDARATAIIAAAKAKYKGGNSGPVPPPPAELIALQTQKDDIVRETVAEMNAKLSWTSRLRVANYMKSLRENNQTVRIEGGGTK